MRRILVVDDDLHVRQAIMGVRGDTAVSARAHGALDRAFGYAFSDTETSGPEFLRPAMRLGVPPAQAVQSTTLLGVIDECPSQAEPHRRNAGRSGRLAVRIASEAEHVRSSDRRAARAEAPQWGVVVTCGNLKTPAVDGRR
jgi:hypothetical protein